jgi:tetratricopeptide (TPR) repeat protein
MEPPSAHTAPTIDLPADKEGGPAQAQPKPSVHEQPTLGGPPPLRTGQGASSPNDQPTLATPSLPPESPTVDPNPFHSADRKAVEKLDRWLRPEGTPGDGPNVPGYEILGELGRGGMGVVYKARQVALNRVVALKMIRHGDSASVGDTERFRTEAEAVARLQHHNIVQIYDVGAHRDLPYFSLEYCPGGSLERKLARTPQPPLEAARLVQTLARAMHHAHEHGIVHRDLKPGNVLIAEDGEPKITDFGLAKKLDEVGQTQTGAIMGTPSYMAPEQALGQVHAIGPHTDVYALGAILYECLTGKPPFKAPTMMETLELVRREDPVPPSRLQPRTPRDLETICLKCLNKDASRRYGSAQEMADDLQRFLTGESILARPAGPTERAVRWARRRPVRATLVGVAVAAVVAVAAAIPLYISTLERKVRQATAERDAEHRENERLKAQTICRQRLHEGREALKRGALEQARILFVQAGDAFPAREDDGDDAVALRTEVDRSLRETDDQLARRAGLAGEQKRLAELLRLRDEAFFLLNQDVVTGLNDASPKASAEVARQALALYGLKADSAAPPAVRFLDRAEQAQLAAGLHEVFLVLAEATARPQPGQAVEKRQLQEALAILQRAERLPPPSAASLRRKARFHEALGDRAAARRESRRAEALPPATGLDWFLAGYDRWQIDHDFQAVLPDFDRALEASPNLFWAHFFRAAAYRSLGNNPAARNDLTACIRVRPAFPWSYVLRGFLAMQAKDAAGAARDLDAALARAGGDGLVRYAVHANRGALLIQTGQVDRALAELDRAVNLRPELHHARVSLAEAHQRRGDFRRALAQLNAAVARQPKMADLYRQRARLHLKLHDQAAGLADLDQAVRLGQGGAPRLLAADQVERGRLLYDAGRYEQARQACVEAGKAQPGYAPAIRLEAEALLQLKRYKEAAAAFERYQRADRARLDANLFHKQALAYLEAGDLAAALHCCTQGLARQPASAELHALRGWALLMKEAPKPAQEDFAAALKLDPKNAEAFSGRGMARAALGQHRQAVQDAEQAVALEPRSNRTLYSAARILARAATAATQGGPRRDPQGFRYQERAAALLRDALRVLPADQRLDFWTRHVEGEPSFAALRRLPVFSRLTAENGQAPR